VTPQGAARVRAAPRGLAQKTGAGRPGEAPLAFNCSTGRLPKKAIADNKIRILAGRPIEPGL